ncbi:TENA/THI-4 domain protein [Acinetobacter sp. NCu2D-2]|uniref:TenA family transcriptional regulator n=1 Tax=Acinetobacter sp. NCu2D-2 TaxID=1608473 RepID=UPI0007CDF30D|nr:iron-containing redox enzyme family protein [Acinetobacter sp. NCu2D-2]ANF81616.1 TENA/THI-4 domain protein [Acinetobacter sp. NCu2D-2]
MTQLKNRYEKVLEITAHEAWSQKFWDDLTPSKDRISQHPFFKAMADGSLSVESFRYALTNFYPLVAHFPSYMGLALSKATAFHLPGVTETRDWLIQNIKVEERHLDWYRDWAAGFGVDVQSLDEIEPPPAMNAVNHFLWNINTRGSLVECLAATNLAIEWATGDWSCQVYAGIEKYKLHPEVNVDKRTLAWLRAHAHYDDLHPYEAMELIKRLCGDNTELQKKAFHAAKTGLAYYELALDECLKMQSNYKKAI